MMAMSNARHRNSKKKIGAINIEEAPENRCVLMELPRLRIQTKPWFKSLGGVTGTGRLDLPSCFSIRN